MITFTTMSASPPKSPLILLMLVSIFFLIVPCLGSAHEPHENSGSLTYHDGPMLTQNVNLGILWYGQLGSVQKKTLNNFIKSLNGGKNQGDLEPHVTKWWKMVESVANKTPYAKAPKIKVTVVNQVTDTSFSSGKVLTVDFIPNLIQKATAGKPNTVAVIFASRMVTVVGACNGDCMVHGVSGKQLYIVVGNPETECPEACAWPFTAASAQGVKLQPPSGNIGADAMVIHFASALAHTVTNPYNTGFYSGTEAKPNEVASACQKIFGSGAFKGYTGKVRVDPKTGGCFNAHGNKGKKFLLPALWNPETKSCWTVV